MCTIFYISHSSGGTLVLPFLNLFLHVVEYLVFNDINKLIEKLVTCRGVHLILSSHGWIWLCDIA